MEHLFLSTLIKFSSVQLHDEDAWHCVDVCSQSSFNSWLADCVLVVFNFRAFVRLPRRVEISLIFERQKSCPENIRIFVNSFFIGIANIDVTFEFYFRAMEKFRNGV